MDLSVREMRLIFCGKHPFLMTRIQVSDTGPKGPLAVVFCLFCCFCFFLIIKFNSFQASGGRGGDCCLLLIAFANSLDPDQSGLTKSRF